MVRAAAKNHPSVAIVTSPDRYDDVLPRRRRRRLHARRAAAAGRRGVRPHRGVRRGGRRVDGAGAGRRPGRPAGRRSPAWRCDRDRGAALRREPAPAGRALHATARGRRSRPPSSCTARRCPTTTTSTPTPPAARPTSFDAADRRDHQARQPVRHRGRRRRRRGPPARPRVRPGLGLRRRDRRQPAGLGRDGRAGGRGVHRGDRRAGVRRRRGRGAPGQEEHPDPGLPVGRRPASRSEFRQISGGAAGAAGRPRRRVADGGGDDPATWTLATGEAASERDARRPRLRLAGLPRR